MNPRVLVIIVVSTLSILASARLWFAGYQLTQAQVSRTESEQQKDLANGNQHLAQLVQNIRLLAVNAAKNPRWKDVIQNGQQPLLVREFAQNNSGFGVTLAIMHDKMSGNTFLSDAPTKPGESWGQAAFFEAQYQTPSNTPIATSIRERPVMLFAENVWIDNEVKAVVAFGLALDTALLSELQKRSGLEFQFSEQSTPNTLTWPANITGAPNIAIVSSTTATGASATSYWLGAVFFIVLGAGGIYLIWRAQAQRDDEQQAFLDALNGACEGNSKALEKMKNTPSMYASTAELFDHWRQKQSSQVQQTQQLQQKLQQQFEELSAQNKALRAERDAAVNLPRTKSEFLSRMGEEITTPMNSMMGMLELLEKYPMSAEPKELLTISLRAGRTLKDNLTNILDFSRMDAGLHKLQRKQVSVAPLVQKVLSEFQHYVDGRNLKLNSSLNVDVPAIIQSDDARIAQVLGNLVGNAVRFTKEGEIGVYVDTLEIGGKKKIRFSVSDTGQGIPKEAIGGLFESLDSRSKLTNASFAGRLRLIVSKQLTELMGGEIGVSSEVGKGSRFWFTVTID